MINMTSNTTCRSLHSKKKQDRVKCYQTKYALQGPNISHPRKRKLIDSKYLDKGDMLVPWTVFQMKRDWNFLVGGFNQSKKYATVKNWESFPPTIKMNMKNLWVATTQFQFCPCFRRMWLYTASHIHPFQLLDDIFCWSHVQWTGAVMMIFRMYIWTKGYQFNCEFWRNPLNMMCVCVHNEKPFGRLVYSHWWISKINLLVHVIWGLSMPNGCFKLTTSSVKDMFCHSNHLSLQLFHAKQM